MTILGPSLANTVKNSRGLYRFVKPLADKYANLCGYRQHGLKYDDIMQEESETVQRVRSLLPLWLYEVFRVVLTPFCPRLSPIDRLDFALLGEDRHWAA